MSNILSHIITNSSLLCLVDAPRDGKEYTRKDGLWTPIKTTIVKNGAVIIENSNITLDLASGNIFVINFTQDSAIDVLNLNSVLSDNNSYVANLKLINAGNYTITWPENFKWAGGVPTFTSNGIDEICIIFYSDGQITVNYALDIK